MRRVILLALLVALTCPVAWSRQAGFTYHEVEFKDDLGRAIEVSSVNIYLPNTTTNATIYTDRSLTNAITQPITEASANTTLVDGKLHWYGPDGWEFTVTTNDGRTLVSSNAPALTANVTEVEIPIFYTAYNSATYTDAQSITLGTDGDFVLAGGATANRLTFVPAADASTVYFGNGTVSTDVRFYGSSTAIHATFDEGLDSLLLAHWDVNCNDDSKIYFGTGQDWSAYSATAKMLDLIPSTSDESSAVRIGANTAGADLYLYGAAAGDYAQFDASANAWLFEDIAIALGDGTKILLGDTIGTGDFSISDESDVLLFDVIVAGTGEMAIGNDGDDVPLTWYAETASSFFKFTGDQFQGDAVQIALGDGDKILFGDALGTGDFSISDETDVLSFRQIVADTGTVAWGVDNAGIDQTWYGESASAYMKWDATSADQLMLVGADSSGTLFAITGIDTTGNTDTMTIAHSGTGDGLQITCTEADSVALNLVAAASQTTSVLKVDGATGSWLGANGVGMVNLTNDGALAHTASSLLYINNTGVPQNDSRGSSLRIVDTGNAAAGTAGYAAYISATDATVEALFVDDGDVKVDEDVIVGGNVINPATAGTKVMSGCPITIEFRPTTAETLTWAVPDGYDLVITDAWGYKIAANGTHIDDELTIQNNDGSAAAVFTKEELGAVNDTLRFQFDGLDDTQNEIEDTSSLDVLANEGGSVDCIIVVTGYLKTAD